MPRQKGLQNGAFFDRRLCNARRFATPRYLLVCEHDVSDWQIRDRPVSITLAPCRAGLGGFMAAQQRGSGDPLDPWFEGRNRGGPGAGSLLLATVLGVGLGLLAAPQPGTKTRKLLLKRLAALGEGVGDGLDEVQDLSSKAKKRARRRLARLRDEAAQGIESVEDRWQHARQKFRAEEED